MQYATFIFSNDLVGSLHNTNSTDEDLEFLSFIHFVGICYFEKPIAPLITNYGHTTPLQLYNLVWISHYTYRIDMKCGYKKVKQAVSNRIVHEEGSVLTYTSLWRHWLESS